jgi:hypothetical protein
MLLEVKATVIMRDGSRREGWFPIGTHSTGEFDFEIPTDEADLYHTVSTLFSFTLEETLPDPLRGEQYRILPRVVLEEEGQRAENYHLLPPGGIPGSEPDTTPVTSPPCDAEGEDRDV